MREWFWGARLAQFLSLTPSNPVGRFISGFLWAFKIHYEQIQKAHEEQEARRQMKLAAFGERK